MPDVPLDVAAARVALSPKPNKEERRPSTAALLAKIPFLQRSGSVSSDHNKEPERDTSNTFPAFHNNSYEQDLPAARRGSALAEVFDAQGARNRRKSSLRKTVLQTTGRFRLDRKGSKEQVPQIVTPPTSPRASTTGAPSSLRLERDGASPVSSNTKVSTPTTSPAKSKPAIEHFRPETPLSTNSYPDSLIDSSQISESPTTFSSTSGYASTIAPDDSASNAGISRFPSVVQTIEIPIASTSTAPASPATLRPPIHLHKTPSPSPPSSESSFPPSSSAQNPLQLPHRRPPKASVPSPSPLISSATDALLAAVSPSPSTSTDPSSTWDYSETEWWGYIILLVTWLVFVVGMGSCFGVWSWAWDVGTTPYAPPEFEDDPTLPIVGYYPALMVLTAVMSWVWVVVAWVGMKYFKHAKIGSED